MSNEDGSVTKDYQSKETKNASGNEGNEIASTNPHTDSEHERGSKLHSRIDLKATVHEDTISAVKKLKASHTASPSSGSSSELVIEVELRLISKSKTKSSSSCTCHNEVQTPQKQHKVDTECSTNEPSLGLDLTHELPPDIKPTMTCPPIQAMEKPSGFDLNRIPSSVFGPIGGDWSAASTDSLFSIHIGNNSFSRDHHSKFSVDFHHKSVGSVDFCKVGGECKSGVRKPPLAVKGKGSGRHNVKAGKKFGDIAARDDQFEILNYEKIPRVVFKEDADTSCQIKKQSSLSDDGSCCSCSFGCWTCSSCCCCTWPSYSHCCKWLSCCCCKWPSCSWQNCCSWPCGCCCSCRPSRLCSCC